MNKEIKSAYLIHHKDDIAWNQRNISSDSQLIAHEDYLPILLDVPMKLFFDHPRNYSSASLVLKMY